ncbi:MAG: GTPase [Campylobacteraceae bacterium]|jgi:bifunctional enzyme CysN/CysC/sulfate adenylyltransferase subunit 1|nr:GTPase [Campylobacteraceae bacterium]
MSEKARNAAKPLPRKRVALESPKICDANSLGDPLGGSREPAPRRKDGSAVCEVKDNRMNIVITGHVDHGKSTLVGRLLADTGSLPEGKLEGVKNSCLKNGRVFEYSMLLDALEDEQKQGITIDSARIFFKSALREYVIIDAPGHIEFLRNMLSGASRAVAAVLVIDAIEGVAENSKRHGLLLSLLGISQVLVAINKLDALNYDEAVFRRIKNEYEEYLDTLNVKPVAFIPISAREGKNITHLAPEMSWYQGKTILEVLDGFHNLPSNEELFFAMPLQDVYRFSNDNDDRRIYAGTIVSGEIKAGDFVKFLPSNKEAHIKNIEVWNAPPKTKAKTNEAVGFTLKEEIYVKNGEVMIKADENALVSVSSKIRANLIWLGSLPLVFHKNYLFKLGSAKVSAQLEKIERVLGDEESGATRNDLKRNECGSVILSLSHPVALSSFYDNATLGRFVLVDNFDAVGGGIVLENIPEQNEDKSSFEDELFALLKKHFPYRFTDQNQILYQI